jgi:regulatory protein
MIMEELIVRKSIISKNKKSVVITFSNNSIYEFPMDVTLKYSLQSGRKLTSQMLEEIIAEKRIYDAMMFAWKKANSSSKTKKEIIKLLRKELYTQEEVDYVIDALEEKHIIDDNRFADNATQFLKNHKLYSKAKIKMYLKNKGIDELIIEDVLSQNFTEEDDFTISRALYQKYKLRISRKSLEKRTPYFINVLQRNGFSFSFARKFILEVLNKEIYQFDSENNE